MNRVVVDASIALRWVLKDEKEMRVDALLEEWTGSFTEMLVPPLFPAEVTNALYLSIIRNRLTSLEARLALDAIMHLGMQVAEPRRLYSRSLELAIEYHVPSAYDAQYLALAEIEGCVLWTADRRLFASLKPPPEWVKLV